MIDTTATRCSRCGTDVTQQRQQLEAGPFADLVARLTVFYCDRCIAIVELEELAKTDDDKTHQQHKLRDERRRASEIPARLRNVQLATLDHKPAVLKAAEHWADKGGGLLLTGDVGRGKTTIAAAAVWRMLDRRHVVWTTVPLLLARLGSGLGSKIHDDALRTLCSTTALALDDIDKSRPTAYGAEQVFLAIDHRITSGSPLIVTSNLTPNQLSKHWPEPFGDAIASRLVGYCQVVRVDGSDRRLVKPLPIEQQGAPKP